MREKISYEGRPVGLAKEMTVAELICALGEPKAVIWLQTHKGSASFTVVQRGAENKVRLTCNDAVLACAKSASISFTLSAKPSHEFVGYLHIDH